ncbi:hypothetical protein [Niabella yanshanensis]|uniref:hypothetical protein n=1 Tax=Niabella yanshanensis TaxID=577386 RepID=UPI0013B35CAB|nr:hypothetical protein [Niabella yanshanensis]
MPSKDQLKGNKSGLSLSYSLETVHGSIDIHTRAYGCENITGPNSMTGLFPLQIRSGKVRTVATRPFVR